MKTLVVYLLYYNRHKKLKSSRRLFLLIKSDMDSRRLVCIGIEYDPIIKKGNSFVHVDDPLS